MPGLCGATTDRADSIEIIMESIGKLLSSNEMLNISTIDAMMISMYPLHSYSKGL